LTFPTQSESIFAPIIASVLKINFTKKHRNIYKKTKSNVYQLLEFKIANNFEVANRYFMSRQEKEKSPTVKTSAKNTKYIS
jgi:hypothetical protein